MGNSPSKSSQGDSTSLINLCLKDERGVAFIVSNRASEDDKNMEELFKEVKFDVHVRNNVTAKQFLATCEYLARYEEYPSTCKMIVIYVSGHGSNGFISMKPEKDHDGRIHVLDLRAMFKNTNIARVFLYDTCRGSNSDYGYTSKAGITTNFKRPSRSNTTGNNFESVNHASQGNDLVAYSTSEYFQAYSDKDGGSWTKTLVLQLRKLKDVDICSVLHKVNGLMKYKKHPFPDGTRFQMPEIYDRLTNNLYLWDQTGK